MQHNRFSLAPKLNRATIRRVPTGRIVLVVSLVWFAATLLIFLHLDENIDTGHQGFSDHLKEDLPDILGAFKKLKNLNNPSSRLSVLNEIVSLVETGVNKTEEILKLIDAEINRIYQDNIKILQEGISEDVDKERILYDKIEKLHRRLQLIIEHNDIPSGKIFGINRHIEAREQKEAKDTNHKEVDTLRRNLNVRKRDIVHLDVKEENKDDQSVDEDEKLDNDVEGPIAPDVVDVDVDEDDDDDDDDIEDEANEKELKDADFQRAIAEKGPNVGAHESRKGINEAEIPRKGEQLAETKEDGVENNAQEQGDIHFVPDPQIPLPDAVYDAQPHNAPGEGGQGLKIDISKLTAEEKAIYDAGEKNHHFNEYASSKISVKRSIPDIRYGSCPRDFRQDLPETSIIICFHNEAWSVLLRTVHSVLDRSPSHLIREIILVDDLSNMPHLKKPLDYYMSFLKKVRIIRTKQREGLMRARLIGVAAATGAVLTFLDSHIECFPGWLEPLLDRVASDDHVLVAPVINSIFSESFAIDRQQMGHRGIFTLENLSFNWGSIPEKLKDKPVHEPLKTPTVAGGLFSISKEYFIQIGKYDEGMDIWGSENVEISLRIWMCGGSLEIHPCSHVAHVFRTSSPYDWGRNVNDILRKNTVRLAEVWLDDYKQFYYERIAYHLGNYGDVSERKKLRQDLKCHDFQWYIDNVYPEIRIPPKAVFLGEISSMNENRRVCLDLMWAGHASQNRPAATYCHGQKGNQLWKLTTEGDLRSQEKCLDCRTINAVLTVVNSICNLKPSQKWRLENNHIINQETGLCLQREKGVQQNSLLLAQCSTETSQLWEFVSVKFLVPKI